jgi:hypothetical protein
MLKTPKISIVPARNEVANLRVALPELYEVREVIRPEIKILHRTRRGKCNALVCRFAAATGDIIMKFDADRDPAVPVADPYRKVSKFVPQRRNARDRTYESSWSVGRPSRHDRRS